MNTTQRVTANWLQNSGLKGEDLLFEALLRRGFLVFRDSMGIWLGSGSHALDIYPLEAIPGLTLKHINGNSILGDRLAQLFLQDIGQETAMEVAISIIALGEHHHEATKRSAGATTTGTGYNLAEDWYCYCRMVWGCKLPVCPIYDPDDSDLMDSDFPPDEYPSQSLKLSPTMPLVRNALDTGIALFVKALPLARIATKLSCDGHGKRPSWVSLILSWDVIWAKAVFSYLNVPHPNSSWTWEDNIIVITPPGRSSDLEAEESPYTDEEVLGVLNDIQAFSRVLLNQELIDKLGTMRKKFCRTLNRQRLYSSGFTEEAARNFLEA